MNRRTIGGRLRDAARILTGRTTVPETRWRTEAQCLQAERDDVLMWLAAMHPHTAAISTTPDSQRTMLHLTAFGHPVSWVLGPDAGRRLRHLPRLAHDTPPGPLPLWGKGTYIAVHARTLFAQAARGDR